MPCVKVLEGERLSSEREKELARGQSRLMSVT